MVRQGELLRFRLVAWQGWRTPPMRGGSVGSVDAGLDGRMQADRPVVAAACLSGSGSKTATADDRGNPHVVLAGYLGGVTAPYKLCEIGVERGGRQGGRPVLWRTQHPPGKAPSEERRGAEAPSLRGGEPRGVTVAEG